MNELRNVIVENLELEAPEILRETDKLYDDLNIDSIMMLQLIVYIEEVFQVSIPEEEIDLNVFSTAGSLADFIESLQKATV
ncbi:acyl carrier protein [Cohnella cholangitidis]|uniref:Acyl carrier protein n=2 Tax=Cohnella cholangitidis TaxID=2598458 RepID=A0A7G5C6Q2_9BACL|nr:acyl carrier protein [Cohnella cholangitidis]